MKMNDPKDWSVELQFRGDELSQLIEAVEAHSAECGEKTEKAYAPLLKKLAAKWKTNA